MRIRDSFRLKTTVITSLFAFLMLFANTATIWAQDPPDVPKAASDVQNKEGADDEADPEADNALMRGPVHEAFAEQFSDDPVPTEVVSKEPPEAIDEIPPDIKPEGENIDWIPGYWGWDVESEAFVWVTGIWRKTPPDQQWVPGYWSKVDNGWQWISGFWTAADSDELVYLPTPPDAVENGPSSEAPGEDYFWIPGSWQYEQEQYAWQAGYWAQGHDNWSWVPNRYVWTPSGCIYREGYWDHELEDRGTIFCPMNFQPGYQQQFQPRYVVEVGPLWLANLFVTPGFNHYCFGNYNGYSGNQTVVPWVNYYQRTQHQDPMYAYYAYQARNANLMRQIGRVQRQISSNPDLRAQATVAAQMRAYRNLTGPQASWALRAIPLKTLATSNNSGFETPFQFASVANNRNQAGTANNFASARQLATQRRNFELAQNNADTQRAQRASNNQNGDTKDANVKPAARGEVKRVNLREEGQANSRGSSKAQVDNEKGVAGDKVKSPDAKQTNRQGETANKNPIKGDNPKAGGKDVLDNRKDYPKLSGKDEPKRNAQAPDRNNETPANKRPDADKPKPSDSKRPGNSLEHLHQGLDDNKSGVDDARALRDMSRRNARGNSGSNQANGAKNSERKNLAPTNAEPKSTPPKNGEAKNPNAGKRPEPATGGANPPHIKAPEQSRPNPDTSGPAAGGKNPKPKAPGPNKPAKPNRGKD